MAARPTLGNRGRPLQLAYWSANSLLGKKLELVQFLSEHGIDICLINETHLVPGQDFRMPNYVCDRNDCPTQGGGTMILVRRGIDHYALPIYNLQELEATAIVQILEGGQSN